MRIVSQDKTYDLPYDSYKFQVSDNGFIYAIPLIDISGMDFGYDPSILGQYSSKEKALKVMEMIRASYFKYQLSYSDVKNTPYEVLYENLYFYMPQDNEVE